MFDVAFANITFAVPGHDNTTHPDTFHYIVDKCGFVVGNLPCAVKKSGFAAGNLTRVAGTVVFGENGGPRDAGTSGYSVGNVFHDLGTAFNDHGKRVVGKGMLSSSSSSFPVHLKLINRTKT